MNIFPANEANIKKAAALIKSGELVAFPTETVYGLGANGLDGIASAKIFEMKNRPSFNPLILHISDLSKLKSICKVKNERTRELMNAFWPGPLTLVLKKTNKVPDIITAGLDSVAVRMPSNETAQKLIEYSDTPIAAPSANSFGKLSPTSAAHVFNQLGEKVKMILNGGNTTVGIESTIIEETETGFYLLRHGGLPLEQIEEITGKLTRKENNLNPNSPGQLPFHYSPNQPLKFFADVDLENINPRKTGALFFKKPMNDIKFKKELILSETGDLREAASNLFSLLYKLESSDVELILVESLPQIGLGNAIMDRLNRASKQFN